MGNRLKELRDQKGLTQEQAAESIGVSRSHWIKLEHGDRKLTADYIRKIAHAFQVAESDVLGGQHVIPIMGYVGAGAEVLPDLEQVPPEGLDQIELPMTVPENIIGFRVRGVSMLPRYDEGDVILVWAEQRRHTDSYLRQEAVVRLADGRRFLKKIMPNGKTGLYRLESFNDYPIENAEIVWVGEIRMIVREHQIGDIIGRHQ